MKKISFISLLGLFLVFSLSAVTSVNFNTTSDLATYFNYPNTGDVTNLSYGGISGTGSVSMPLLVMGQSRVVTYKTGFRMPQVNESITVSAYMRSFQQGGYGGIGFSSASTNTASNLANYGCRINSVPAMGMRFHSGGYSLFNNQETGTSGLWGADIPLQWYKVVFILTPLGGNSYTATYQLFSSTTSGTIGGSPLKTNTVTFTNTTIDDGLLYPYFVTDGMRINYVDNFSFTPSVVLYDFPQGGVAVNMPSSPAGNTLQFTAGNANIATGTPSTALNPAFTPSFTQFLTLVGAGPWTFVINTTYDWIWVVGHPVAYAGPGPITITHPASKDATIEIQGGSGENPTLPVELSSFTAVLNTEYFVNLAWVTQSETDLNGFVIYRSETDDLTQACIVSGIIPATNSSTEATYSFSDTEVENNTTYYYWLNSVELSGNGDFHGPVQITVNHNDGEVPPPEIPFSSGIKRSSPILSIHTQRSPILFPKKQIQR
jgi:hypothetical protein